MITETLGPDPKIGALGFQTQLLKLYFLTTLYVDVKEPALRTLADHKKTQLRRRLESRFRLSGRDKIESNLQSPNVQERTPLIRGVPRLAGLLN